MVDQTSNTGRDSTRQGAEPKAADPKGVDAALAAGDGVRRGEDAAGAAQAFAEAGRPRAQQAIQPDGAPNDVRGSGMHMMETASSLGGGAVSATRDVLRGAIGATEDVATGLIGGASHVAADLVHGVRDVGYEVRDGASGLIGAVGTVGGSAVYAVANLLADIVGGVRHVVGAAMGHDGNVQQREAGNGQRQGGIAADEREREREREQQEYGMTHGIVPPPNASKGSGGASPRA